MLSIQRRELLVGLAIGLTFALSLLAAVGDLCIPAGGVTRDQVSPDVELIASATPTFGARRRTAEQVLIEGEDSQPVRLYLSTILAGTTVRAGDARGRDEDDVLLLHDSRAPDSFDVNFRRLADYYGVRCKTLDLRFTPLTDDLLRDARGSYLKLVGISAGTLGNPSLVSSQELDLLRDHLRIHPVTLLVGGLRPEEGRQLYTPLRSLTDNTVLGAMKPEDSHADWFVSDRMPELTGIFTGQTISCTQVAQSDAAILLNTSVSATSVVTAVDDSAATYPVFVHYRSGSGSVLVTGGDSYRDLNSSRMGDLYEPCTFSELVPLMFAFRFSLGEEVWHSNRAYANLTIDDPALRENSFDMGYDALLAQMKRQGFHTTIALMPRDWDQSDPVVTRLFLAYPEYLSIVQHGNNNDLYEFYKYEVTKADPYPARPLSDQKADIVEGLARMEEHQKLTGVPYGKIMVFPYGISPAPTLEWLKANNFNATINANPVPLTSEPGDAFDFEMYQAITAYGNFPSVRRHFVPPGGLSETGLQWLLFDLFIGKPILVFSHADEVFRHGMDGFNETADAINRLPVSVEWHSLDHIIKHLYLEKSNDDGSIDVKWYGNHIIVDNPSRQGRTYHLQKEETLNVPIDRLTVEGRELPFRVEDGMLLLDVYVPGGSSVEVVIYYGA